MLTHGSLSFPYLSVAVNAYNMEGYPKGIHRRLNRYHTSTKLNIHHLGLLMTPYLSIAVNAYNTGRVSDIHLYAYS